MAATDLPMGSQKQLEVIRALMAEPRLLLLDEPAAGLNPSEKRELSGLLRELARRTTILLVEHDMTMVMSLSDHITVLANGAKIAAGDAATVRGDPDVVAAYLGPEAVAAAHG
jgi:branched-chain amino acid transport system ATP-binding protein